MRRSFITKLIFLIIIIGAIVYYTVPNINILLARIDSQTYKHITIFYTNDIHGHIMKDQKNGVMGMALIKGLVNRNSKNKKNIVLLDAGDTLFGTNETDLNDGLPQIEILNTMGYSAMAIGNHEFDFGVDKTMNLYKKAEFPFLSANLFKDGKRMFDSYTILEVDDINLGIIGISTSDTLTRTKPEYVKDLSLKDCSEVLNDILIEIKPKCDYIILLAHEHIDTLRDIAKEFPDINLIIEGHDHVQFRRPEKIGNCFLTSAGVIGMALGKIDLVFRDNKPVYTAGRLLKSNSTLAQDKEILAIENLYHQKIFNELNVKIGETLSDLTDLNGARYEEVNFGNVLTDAMRESTGADIALQNGGGIRTNISRGDITLYGINEAFPFVNYVIEVEMSGSQIKDALEHGVERYPTEWNGGFLQVSGLTYTFDADKPSGERLIEVLVDGKPIEENEIYSVATNDFLHQGGDGHESIQEAKLIFNTGKLIKDVFTEYVERHEILDVKLEGRIKILNSAR